jgi:hypothetical protein
MRRLGRRRDVPSRRRRWLVAALTIVAASVSLGGARAECVYAEAYVTREGDTPVYVIGENDPCVTPTPWYQEVFLPLDGHQNGLPTGAPNGFLIDLRVPVP